MGERVLCKHEVVGSIPSASTIFHYEDHRDTGFTGCYEGLGLCLILDIVKRTKYILTMDVQIRYGLNVHGLCSIFNKL